jgi:hypothetical protein
MRFYADVVARLQNGQDLHQQLRIRVISLMKEMDDVWPLRALPFFFGFFSQFEEARSG